MNEFSIKFGEENALLTSSVEGLLSLDEEERPSPCLVYQTLPPYDHVKEFLMRGQSSICED